MSYAYDWSVVVSALPALVKGLRYTVALSLLGFGIALAVGLLVALCRMSSWRLLSGAAFLYTQVFRAISIYIYIVWVYFGIAGALGIDLSPFAAGVISLVLLNSAYMSEIYRAAIESVDAGQREAARSLGLGRVSTFLDVVLPQALRVAIPGLINQFTGIIKDSSVVAIVGANDLMYETIRAANFHFKAFEFYTVAALIYLALVLLASWLGAALERVFRGGQA